MQRKLFPPGKSHIVRDLIDHSCFDCLALSTRCFSGFAAKRVIHSSKLLFLAILLCLSGRTSSQTLSDTMDVIEYSINLDVLNLPAKVIKGNTGIELTVKQPSIEVIGLDLKYLSIDSVVMNGELLFVSGALGEDRYSIYLPEAINPGDTIFFRVYYHGIPFSESWGGFHFAGSYAFNLGVGFQSIPHNLGKAWFPCVDDFKDRAFYEYRIRVENANKAVCGGLLQSVTDNNDGTHTFYWKTFETIPTYLASVAVGPYALKTDIFNGLQAQVPITYYVRPADTNKVNGSFTNLKAIASIYEDHFGPYPFNRIGITGTSLGAMEHAENIAYPNGSISGSPADEWLYAHELSHMWFGDYVTCATDADMWLNEGWARWCELIFTEGLYGQEQSDEYYKTLLRDVLQYTHLKDGGYRALFPMDQQFTYGSTVYDKGALVAHSLRHYIGDSLFFPAIRDYLQLYSYDHADSYQLRDALENSTGMDLNEFFDFFVFTPGFTHYSVDSFNVTPAGEEFEVSIFMKQKHKGTTAYASNCKVDLSFMNRDRSLVTRQVSFSGITDTVSVLLDFEPILVTPDLFYRTSDATTDELKTLCETGTYDYKYTFCKVEVNEVADSAWVRVTHNWVGPDTLQNPQTGLHLSSNHYWTVEGIFPEGFNAKGIFNYNKNILDSDIITNADDSLVMLYREHPGQDWRGIDFTRTGPWQLGYLNIWNLKPGQYTLAVWDEEYVGIKDPADNTGLLRIFPNPAPETITIQVNYKKATQLFIFNSAGQNVHTCKVGNGEIVKWSGSPGTYLVALYQGRKKIATSKAFISR